jgi:F-type H+-transporting ATPase subunit c
MSTTPLLLAQGITDSGLKAAGALIGGGSHSQAVPSAPPRSTERNRPQPEAQARLYTTMFLIIGLCEAAYFINVAFMAMFVFVLS